MEHRTLESRSRKLGNAAPSFGDPRQGKPDQPGIALLNSLLIAFSVIENAGVSQGVGGVVLVFVAKLDKLKSVGPKTRRYFKSLLLPDAFALSVRSRYPRDATLLVVCFQ
jgi:hypothetical protein